MKKYKIQTWTLQRELEYVEIEADVETQTEKGICLIINGSKHWFPQSAVEEVK